MSRSGYDDSGDFEMWGLIRYRGAVASAIRGKRGQNFLLEMWHALHALPEHKLIAEELEADGEVCAIGSVGKARGIDMQGIDPDDAETVAKVFNIPESLAREIVWLNDEAGPHQQTPEQRWQRMKDWIARSLLPV